jgi:DNA-binding CsgD family transcriptional regulator
MRDRLLQTMTRKREEADAFSADRLSGRERDVIELIGQGYGAAEVGKLARYGRWAKN